MGVGNHVLENIREQKAKQTEDKEKERFNLVQLRETDCQFQVKYKDIDKYGIVVDYISLSKNVPIMDVDVINKRLEKQAEAVQKTITYLLEDFRLIEFDKMNKRAQLRSYPPHKKGDSKFYYEIVLDEGTRLHFQRYEYSSAKRRYEKITSQLTLETFERLIDDLFKILCAD